MATVMMDTERTEKLRSLGFVHVTNLPTHNIALDSERLVQARRNECGKSDSNNGKTQVVTEDGEVWLAAGYFEHGELRRFCPIGTGAFVYCTNGDTIPMSYLLERFRDPSWSGHNNQFSPVPTFCD